MAELRRAVKWLLFLSSYIPLYLILSIKHWNITVTVPRDIATGIGQIPTMEIPIVSIGWLTLAGISGGILAIVISIRRSKGGQDFKEVESFQNRDDLITNYILVYVFPFVVLNYSNLANWVAFVIFFSVIGIIQVRSNQLYVNPILAIYDYHIYEVETDERVLTVISKQEIDESVNSLKTVELSNGVYLTV